MNNVLRCYTKWHGGTYSAGLGRACRRYGARCHLSTPWRYGQRRYNPDHGADSAVPSRVHTILQ